MGNISRKNGTNCDRHAKHVGASERDPIFAKFGRDDPPVKGSIDLLSRFKCTRAFSSYNKGASARI